MCCVVVWQLVLPYVNQATGLCGTGYNVYLERGAYGVEIIVEMGAVVNCGNGRWYLRRLYHRGRKLMNLWSIKLQAR